jgi:PAS domain S-box-containing protein
VSRRRNLATPALAALLALAVAVAVVAVLVLLGRLSPLGGIAVTAFVFSIAALAAYVIQIVRPIQSLAVATQRLAGGDLSERVEPAGPGEIGELGRAFNAMAASLEQNRRDLEAQNVELTRLAHLLRAVLDSTVDGILLTDLEGNVQLANRPMLRYADELGFAQDGTAVDRLLSISTRVTEVDRFRETMERLRSHPDEPSRDEFELREPRRTFQGFTSPVRGDGGGSVGRIWTLREVTQERELDRLKNDFMASVSHELRTPLTAMMGFLEILRNGGRGELTGEQERFLSIVYRSAERLQRLVGDLLFVAHLDAAGLDLRLHDTDIGAVAAECVAAAGATARARDIDLRHDARAAPRVRGDPERLAQLIENLLSNALKFTPAGGSVTVRTFPAGDAVVLEVEDTGPGIPTTDRRRLFERFFRSSMATAQAIPGLGLGLVIAKAIVDAHGGELSVTSEPGSGTCFRAELPAA